MSAKKALRGLAMGAILAGVAALVIKMKEEKNRKKAKQMADRAQYVSAKVIKHAQKMGKLSRSAFGNIVDAAVDEYKGMKEFSEAELKEMKAELKESWEDIHRIMAPELPCPPKKAASRAKKPAARKAKGKPAARKAKK